MRIEIRVLKVSRFWEEVIIVLIRLRLLVLEEAM